MLDGLNDPKAPRPQLVLLVEEAREEEIARGVAAAEAVLYRDGDIDLVAAMAANVCRDFSRTLATLSRSTTSPTNNTGSPSCGRTRSRRRSMRVVPAGPNDL
jgi:hypothetical protein